MLNEKEAIESFLEMIPNWYGYDKPGNRFSVMCGDTTTTFRSQRALTPSLVQIKDFATTVLPSLINTTSDFSKSTARKIVQESIAIGWLTVLEDSINWKKLIEFNDAMAGRTYENDSIAINLLFDLSGDTDTYFDITTSSFSKLIDPLGKDNNVFFAVNGEAQFLTYDYVKVNELEESAVYKFYPEFLHSYQRYKVNKDWRWSFHRTSRGDLIICDLSGIRASFRKGNWYLYEPATLKNMLTDIMSSYSESNNYWVGCNLYEIVFDLSYKRHGALLAYTNDASFSQFITNQESIFNSDVADEFRKGIGDSLNGFYIASEDSQRIFKRKFLEMASMDGAIIFGNNHVRGFGSMIKTAEGLSAAGARTTASLSALQYGAFPIKISSDGQITMYDRNSDCIIEFM